MVNSSLFRRLELQLLMNLTAKAFQKPPERLWTRPDAAALEAYAKFTCSHLETGADELLLQRMNDEAYHMGLRLRRLFFIWNRSAAEQLIVALYRNIGIKISFSDSHHVCFHSCFFSRHYTPAVCLAASALDDGIIRGLTGEPRSRLCFTQRITEGCDCCKATFRESGEPSLQSPE